MAEMSVKTLKTWWFPESQTTLAVEVYSVIVCNGIWIQGLKVDLSWQNILRSTTGRVIVIYHNPKKKNRQNVQRCGASGSMRACHAAGPGSIPGRRSFLGEVFSGFSSPVRQMSGSFRPPKSPNIIWPSLSSILIIQSVDSEEGGRSSTRMQQLSN